LTFLLICVNRTVDNTLTGQFDRAKYAKAKGNTMEDDNQVIEATEPAAAEPVEATEVIEGAEPSEGVETVVEPPAKKENRVQERFDQITREKYEARAEANRLQSELDAIKKQSAPPQTDFIPPGFPAEPQLDSFDDYDQYNRALVRWEAGRIIAEEKYQTIQAERQKAGKAVVDTYKARVEAAKQTHTDWDEVIAIAPDFVYPQTTVDTILESEQGAEIQYYLAANPAEAERVHKLNPVQQIKEIARLEVKFSKQDAAPTKRVSQAPSPIAPVGGNDSGIVDIDKLEGEAWLAADKARLAKLGRRY
jgi:hypothetical protein